MQITLSEPSNFRYIRINTVTNRIRLLVPFIAGQDISTDNTCQSKVELKAFFEGGAFSELVLYKSILEFHIALLEEGDLRQAKIVGATDHLSHAPNLMRKNYLEYSMLLIMLAIGIIGFL